MIELPWKEPARVEALLRALSQRILVIDGAMGTMIQQHELDEAGYRGTRFAQAPDSVHFSEGEAHRHAPGESCGHELKGNNDLLTLTRPELIRGIHDAYLEAGADLLETNTFNSTKVSQADYKLEHLVTELELRGREAGPRLLRRRRGARSFEAALRGGRARPDLAHRLDEPGRQRPGLPQHLLRRLARRLPGRGARAGRRRRRRGHGRDGVRHPQRQGGGVRAGNAVRGARGARAGDAVGHHHRPLRPHAVGTDRGGLLVFVAALASQSPWA
jgi:hypothetical protein